MPMDSGSLLKPRARLEHMLSKAIYSVFTEYETPKLVLIHSFTLTLVLRIMQIILLMYSVLYLLIYEKGYQKQDTSIVSSATLKVKGIGYVQLAGNQSMVTDVADYIVPPSENDAIFIMSNFLQTDQMRSRCAESNILKEAQCQNDYECLKTPPSSRASGRWTGRCVLPTFTATSNATLNSPEQPIGLCEYAGSVVQGLTIITFENECITLGWCPAENDEHDAMFINNFLNFTIFIKNFIEFPIFHVKHKNMVDNLQACVFDPTYAKDCPIFSLGYILDQAEKDPVERALMLRHGSVVSVKVNWDCNLDRHIKLCKPEYTFARLDVPFRERPFSRGFNFRFASYWKDARGSHRILTKAYGLRLIIAVSGKAGKFDIITLSLNTGSLVGIFGLATFLCDIILLHFSKQSRAYRQHVFETVHMNTRSGSIVTPNAAPTGKASPEKETPGPVSTPIRMRQRTSLSHRSTRPSPRILRKTVSLRPLTFTRDDIAACVERV